MDKKLIIRGLSTISALGTSREEINRLLEDPVPGAVPFGERNDRPVFPLTDKGEALVRVVASEERHSRLDRVAHLAIAAVRRTLDVAGGRHGAIGCVSIGSSRGATIALERTISNFAVDPSKVPTETSPTTTAGNISSWVAQECISRQSRLRDGLSVASIGTSMTCSSAFQSLLTAAAFVRSGMTSAALFGGAESCLTPYTIAHLEALRIYSDGSQRWPCRPCGSVSVSSNTVVLGEGAGTAIVMADDGAEVDGDLALLGLGWAIEETPTATGLSADGRAFERSMRMALESLPSGVLVDTVVAHAPGSIKGDEAELSAITRTMPIGVRVVSTKHLTGHTYGASGMVSLALAQALIEGAPWAGFSYESAVQPDRGASSQVVLINTAGFGGNSVSVIVGPRRPENRVG
jgi:3-oxoacyl-(acyl-carrier-protein) synthase